MARHSNTAPVTSGLRPTPRETWLPTMTVVETSLRSFQPAYPQYQLWVQQLRLPPLLLQLRSGARTKFVLTGDRTLLVANTSTDSVPFGKFGAKVDSMLSHPKTSVLTAKVYIVAGRVATTGLDVLPSFTTERSTVVCVETIITLQLSMLMFCSANPPTGIGKCRYRLAPGAEGNFIPGSKATYYAAARRISAASIFPVSFEMAYQSLYG
jgi:hypothetical protein